MKECRQFYIDGKWVAPTRVHDFPVLNPATEERIAVISLGTADDVEKAVAAARRAFESYSETSREERLALLQRIIEVYQSKYEEMAETISQEMGAPLWLARAAQAAAGLGHLFEMAKVLGTYQFEELKGSTLMRKEPIGVCAAGCVVSKTATALAAASATNRRLPSAFCAKALGKLPPWRSPGSPVRSTPETSPVAVSRTTTRSAFESVT